MQEIYQGCITDVPGVKLGHAVSKAGRTGCSVILLEQGGIAGIDIGGSAPGTRETEMLNPTNQIMKIHSILLAGGSTFGLSATTGVQHYLQEHNIGYLASTGVVVPIVPSAVIFDLDIGKPQIYPDREMGYRACQSAVHHPSLNGMIGAGYGALCGKVLGSNHAMKGGLATTSCRIGETVVMGAVAVCNAWGDVLDPGSNRIITGAKDPDNPGEFLNTNRYIRHGGDFDTRFFGRDTTLCVVATNAKFNREEITKIALMAQDGIARIIRPSHTMFDGDIVFTLATGTTDESVDETTAGAVAADLVEQAIVRSVCASNGITLPQSCSRQI